jgi:pentatricopeptide repeat protein
MVHEGVSPDATTLVHCLKVCREESTIKTGQGIHKIIICKGLDDAEALLHSSLVDMYAKRGRLVDAEKVFNSIPVYCPFSWTTLITAFIDLGHVEELCKFLERICADRARTDLILLACMLRACSCIGDRGKGLAIHTQILLQGVEGDIIIGSAVIDMYVKFGWIAEAEAIFGKLPVRMVFAWTTLITGYVYHGWDDCALDCFERMQEACVSPDDVTLACTLIACGNLGSESKGSKVFSYVAFKGLECDNYIGNSLVDMYVKGGLLAEAQEVFNGLSVKAEIAWTALITGYSQAGETENAFMNFGRMLEGNVKPTGVTFISILSACSHGGLVEKGEYYFNVMIEDFKSIPTLEHYGCMVDLLGRAGQLGNAVAVVERMPYHPVNVVWLTLLGACQKWDNIRLGQEAFQHTQELNEYDIAPHISMLNMYINAGITENLSMLGECTR